MPDLIGFQDGINATEINLKALDPAHQAGYDKVANYNPDKPQLRASSFSKVDDVE